jgi:hypothetical protein
MHELRLKVKCPHELDAQLAALGLLRQLPALATLQLALRESYHAQDHPVQWPPFLPPSLKALRIVTNEARKMGQSLLCALPGMLGASGARLERLEVPVAFAHNVRGDGLVHVAQAVRCCSPTLKVFRLEMEMGQSLIDPRSANSANQTERLRVHWADVMAGVSTCRELEVLALPPVEIEPLFPPGTAFARLTDLEVYDHQREHPPDAGAVGLWELMASGGLPALAKLKVKLEGVWGGSEEVRTRVAPAFEAVAGTLTHLSLAIPSNDASLVGMGYELGVAVGKLRRLKDLALGLSRDGRTYHALAQGVAASGGSGPLPLLWRVRVDSDVEANADLLASLLLPSVRVLVS